ncbi:antibiotic biosynthesis monooxygenase [Sphingomonas sp.]|uniref:antibiotic biosynthesis monooxygenase family protein n=1 Tax=Sphingomonas sp. TaxID=28214 RepID=UPI001DE2B2EB|nr:antibiotic biosynthesis monooxygenase [Sphingomonas sp.]MBX9797039.1 antibiotic biosynthesis monooxygenase [Sphingomonas sp.]
MGTRTGQTVVIFIARRTAEDAAGYAEAAAAMDALAAAQPGYCGMESVRGAHGLGITVSFWADDASARAWRDHADHRAVRDAGRDRWYHDYQLSVATITRDYDWARA